MFWQHDSPNIIQPVLEFCLGLKRALISLRWSARAYFNPLHLAILENQQITSRRGRHSTEDFIASVDKVSTHSQLACSSYSDSINAMRFIRTGDVCTFIPRVLSAVLRTILTLSRALKSSLALLTGNSSHTTFDSSLVLKVACLLLFLPCSAQAQNGLARDWKHAIWRAPLHVALSVPVAAATVVVPPIGKHYIAWRTRAELGHIRTGKDSQQKATIDLYSQTVLPYRVLRFYHVKVP